MWVERLTQFFLRRPTLFWSVLVGIVLAGIIAFVQMPKLEDPAVSVKQAQVVAVYQGATAHEVELKVAKVIEDQLRTLPDVKELRTECQNGMAMITVEFLETVLSEHLEQHFDLLRRKINDVKSQLPSGCMDPIVVDDMMDVYGIFYALISDGYTYPEMDRYAQYIRNHLLKVKGVKRVNIVGVRTEEIQVILSKEKLARNGIVPTQIMMQLQNHGKVADVGKYADDGQRIQLRVSEGIDNEEDIRDLLIKTTNGRQVRIGDMAEVRRTYKEPQTGGFFVDGKPALALCIALQEGVVVPDVGKAVDEQLARTMAKLPAGLSTEKIFFQPDKVDQAISTFVVNLIESVLIVILVLIFTMGFRSGVIIGVGLMLTIAVSFPILLTMGTTLQRISLGAFIIAMGMLVDNSIVIMDGILVDKRRGLGPKTYLYRIGKNTAMPLLGATIIAASTFLNSFLSPDSTGEYSRDLFLVLCVSLLASWVLALVQVPICAKSWMPVREQKQAGKKGDGMDSPVHRLVRRVLVFLIGWKKTAVAAAVVLLVICMAGGGHVKNLFFPDFDYNQFVIEYQLPPQASPDQVRSDLLSITAELDKNPKVDRVAMSMGNAPAHYCLVRPMTSGGDTYGELMVDCKDFKTVKEVMAEIRPQLRQAYPDAYIRFRNYNFSISTSHPVEVQFRGPDPAVLRHLAEQAEAIMRECPYADRYSVQNNWRPVSKSLVADFAQKNALRSGISRGNVADALLAATDGLPIGVVNDNDKMLVVNLLVRNEDGSRITDLNDIPVWSMMNFTLDGEDVAGLMSGSTTSDDLQDNMFRSVPLNSVTSEIEPRWEESYVYRVNGERTIEAECDPNTTLFHGTAAKVVAEIKDQIERIPLPDGYTMQWAGETKVQGDSTDNILRYMPLTMFIVLGILLLLFNNWKEVILIISCLPFVFVGIIPSLLVFRQPFTFMAIIGVMGLIGMMTKNAIVLVDEINRLYKEERRSAFDSVVTATVSRVRPVIMASLTTILGMAPLLGDPMYGSMAITIMAGLTMGTLITLVFLPVVYSTLFHVKVENP